MTKAAVRAMHAATDFMACRALEAPLNLTWIQAVLQNYPRARFYCRADRAAPSITLRAIDPLSKVLLWQATNRKLAIPHGVDRSRTDQQPRRGRERYLYRYRPAPAQGWTAFFLEPSYAAQTKGHRA